MHPFTSILCELQGGPDNPPEPLFAPLNALVFQVFFCRAIFKKVDFRKRIKYSPLEKPLETLTSFMNRIWFCNFRPHGK